ncbi:outer membrane protein assembly factor BamA [Geminicoccaceae bacterium 1502E]|nr:outer membrane protein assembly factor BamA [Geminicoccaceae bacterium 1502E]
MEENRRLAGAGMLALALLGATPALAQQAGRVEQIIVQGNERIEGSTVETYLAIRRGDAFDAGALDTSLKNLFATGLFEDVSIRRENGTLVVQVVENPILNRIAFEGNRTLDDKILEAEVQLRPRVVYTRQRVQDAVQRILDLYRRNGRYAARVEPKIIELDQNRVDLVFEIDEGDRTQVGGITFIGNEEFSDGTLRSVVQTREAAWYRFFTSDDTYDPDRLAFDQELLRRFYHARGYADFAVVSALAELTPDGKEFFITFTVEEGPRYTLGSVDLKSEVPDLSADALRQYVETEPGDIYNADEIEQTIQKLTDELGSLGYAFVEVDTLTRRNAEDLTIDLVYDVREGPRVYVERIDISGNVRTLDQVIRREFRLAEGDAFNTALLRRSQQRLRNLGFFEKVDVRTEQGDEPDRIVIKVAVTEQSTGELSFGAGYSTSDGPLGDIRLRERNLLGRGQDLQANLTVSGRRQEVLLSFTEPYFLERDLAAGFDLFRSRTDYQSESNYDQTITGGTLRASYPLTENLRHGVRYTLRNDSIHNVDTDASRFIQDEEGDRLTSLVGQTFTYDRRDTRFMPSEGYYLRLDQDVAGLGGDNRFLKHDARADYYYPFTPNWVLNLGASAGYILGYGGEDVHLSNRFFLGGQNFRGFEYGGIGPRDSKTDDALGGNAYYVGTAELRFPLGLPEELRIFGRTFAEAGTLTDIDIDSKNITDSGNMRVSGGFGLSWLSPLGPLSIDFANAFVKEDEDKTETFRLSFGTRF